MIVKRILETMKRTILASILGALSLNAFAASPSYDFIKAGHVQADIEEDETAFEIGADYFFTPQFSFGATYVIADDVDLLGVSARYTF